MSKDVVALRDAIHLTLRLLHRTDSYYLATDATGKVGLGQHLSRVLANTDPRTPKTSRAAGIGGACFLICLLILAGLWIYNLIGMFLPPIGEIIAWIWCPQFVLGMFFTALLISGGAFALATDWRRNHG